MANVYVPGPLRSWSTSLDECHAAHIVLIDYCRSDVVPLRDNQVPKMDSLTRSIGQAHKLGLCASLGHDLLLGRLSEYVT